MRLFALEYYRQLISSDLTHFHSTKEKAQLKFKDQLGPFVMNKKDGWQDVDQMLGEKYRLKRSFWWVPYYPCGFINARKIKYRLSAYDHCKIPEIEQFSNQDEWVQGTLVEEFSQEEIMEKNVKIWKKTLDLDSFEQVTFKLPRQVGEGTSTAAVSQATKERTTPTVGTTKGKEVIDTEQEIMAEKPTTSKEQGQGQAPPL